MDTKLLDCTIRDGGHLNGWNFDEECVKASYSAALKAGADYFEIGYRFKNISSGMGKFAKCDDDYIMSILTPEKQCKLSVMADAKKSDINDFKYCCPELTPVTLVRVATYPDKLNTAFDFCEGLKQKGYEVFLNLMAVSEYTERDFKKIEDWENKDCIDSVCFADSFGSFIPQDIVKYKNKLKSLGFNNISLHSHNNIQMAFANTLKAVEEGFYCVDASIYGMGRGSGNLPAEIITGYLAKLLKNDNYNPVYYIDVIRKFYIKLKNETPWGYTMESLIGGLKNIHPYYVDSLFENGTLTTDEIWEKVDLIKKNAPIYFDENETGILQ